MSKFEDYMICIIRRQLKNGDTEEEIMSDLCDCDTGENPEYTIKFMERIIKKAKEEL